jgi:predicted protein tyrosine phosphatase
MEEKHRRLIKENAKTKADHKIRVLNIPDLYKFGQAELVCILKEKTEGLF